MDNKKLGIVIITISVLLLIILFYVKLEIEKPYKQQIESYGESCPTDPDICPHVLMSKAQIPIYIGVAIVFGLISLAMYLIFFEKSQREIINTIKETKEMGLKEDRFGTLLMGFDENEKNVIKAIKDQDGISQSTLLLRTDLSKAKLSMVLTDFEKKGLIKKVKKGKINNIFLKEAL